MKDKTIFVLWSGGLDSTYLIYKLLQEGYKVKAGYINILSNGKQTERELEAIEKMLPYFSKLKFEYLGPQIEFTFKSSNNNWLLSYPPLFLMLPYIVPSDVDEIAIGYVMNDDAISFLTEIKTVYDSMDGLCVNPIPTLIFPIIKTKKDYMWQVLPEELKTHVTWCENHHGEPNMDNCPSCKRMESIIGKKEEKAMIDLSRLIPPYNNDEEEYY